MKNITFTAIVMLMATPVLAQSTPGDQFMDSWDLNDDGKVMLEELVTMRGNVFDAFDTDQNGYLNAEEYIAFDNARAGDVANYDDPDQRAQMQSVADGMSLSNSDTDGDGRVGREEFLAGADDWFVNLDTDNDGRITLQDFQTAISQR